MSNQTATAQDRTAGVIPTAPWRLKSLSVLPGHRLAVRFQDDRSGIVDFSLIKNSKAPGVFAQLADPDFFEKVRLELGAVTWPNGADIDPEWMYDMLEHSKTWSVPY